MSAQATVLLRAMRGAIKAGAAPSGHTQLVMQWLRAEARVEREIRAMGSKRK